MAINVYECPKCGERTGFDSTTVHEIEEFQCSQCGGSLKLMYSLDIAEPAESSSIGSYT